MDNNNEAVEVVDQSTGEIVEIKTPHKLVAETRDTLLRFRRAQQGNMPWDKLPQADQQKEIDGMNDLAFDIVNKVVEIVAEAECTTVVTAQLESYTVKDGATKIVAKGRASDDAVLELNRVGKKVLKIIVVDGEKFDAERPVIKAQPDQPELLEEDPIYSEEDADTPSENNPEVSVAFENGLLAFEQGNAEVSNPYPDDTVASQEWTAGFDYAENPPEKTAALKDDAVDQEEPTDEEAEQIVEDAADDINQAEANLDLVKTQGAIAFTNDQPSSVNPHAADTLQYGAWVDGYDEAKGQGAKEPEEVKDTKSESDAYYSGFSMATEGHTKDENPHEEGTVEQKDWDRGHSVQLANIETVKAAGRKAKAEGTGPHRNPHGAGIPEHGWWNEGWEEDDK